MLRLLLVLATTLSATVATSRLSANTADSSKLRVNSHSKSKAGVANKALAELKLPAASHELLMAHIRAHPDWFVHMNIDDKHHITKLPTGGKVGGRALSLLQLHISMELSTKNEHGMMEATQLHELDMSTLNEADKATVATIKSEVNVDTKATQGDDACPINNYVTTATFDEKDHSHVGVNPVCGECAPKCELCIGASMNMCKKCQPELGEEAFLVRFADDPDVCLTRSKCNAAAGRVVNETSFECDLDWKFTGTPATDDMLFEMAMEGEEKADLDTLGLANAVLEEDGKPEISKADFKEKEHEAHQEEQKEYKESHSGHEESEEELDKKRLHAEKTKMDSEIAILKADLKLLTGSARHEMEVRLHEAHSDAEALQVQIAAADKKEDEKEAKEAAVVTANLLEIQSKLKSGLGIAAKQEVGATFNPMDKMCHIYKKGWKNNPKVHKNLGGLIFGYDEGQDSALQGGLDGSSNFGDMFNEAGVALENHDMGFGKKIAKIVDEDMSAESGDSFWCQAMMIVEGLDAQINDDSSLASFLQLAHKIIMFLEKTIGGNSLIKTILGLIKDVFNWMNKMRESWAGRLESLQENPGYVHGVSKMCDFSNTFRTFLSKMQSMCHVNDLLAANKCASQQLFTVSGALNNVNSIAIHNVDWKIAELGRTFEDETSGKSHSITNAADRIAPMEEAFTYIKYATTLARTVNDKIAPFWNFLETDHPIKFGCVWLPTWYWWPPYFYEAACVVDTTINIMNLFETFGSIISLCLSFLKFMFAPLIDAVNARINAMKEQAMNHLESMFNANFDLDKMLVIPELVNGLDSKMTKYQADIMGAMPMDAMLQGYETIKNKLSHLTNQDQAKCGQHFANGN